MLKPRLILGPLLVLLGSLLPAAHLGAAGNAATILSVSYVTGDARIHIGSAITVNMVILDVTAQISGITTANGTATSLDVVSASLASVPFATDVYVTDGTRTWKVAANASTTVQINNGNLLGSGAGTGWSVSNYVSLANQTLRVYVGNPGNVLNGLSAPAPTVIADIGAFGIVVLKDQGGIGGAQGDALAYDQIWSGVYYVPDLGMTVTDARIYGHAEYNGLIATNDDFVGPISMNIDGLRPSINTVNFTVPAKPNYNNVLYLSANSQGTTGAAQTNTIGRFDVTANKVDTILDIQILSTPPRSLPSVVVPAGSQTLTGWTNWDGRAGDNTFVPDGIYSCKVYIKDGNGVTGLTKTTQVRVTSMVFEIADIKLSPSGRNTQPVFTAGMITTIESNIRIRRENGGSLRESLFAVGWPRFVDFANTIPTQFGGIHYKGSVWGLQEIQFLDQAGTKVFGIDPNTDHDSAVGTDHDPVYHARFSADPTINGWGDDNLGNDWDASVFRELTLTSGTVNDPTLMTAPYYVSIIGKSPEQGNYRLRLRSTITGIQAVSLTTGVHWYPTIAPEGPAENRGLGISVEDSSIIFQVSEIIVPVTDNTPPVFLSSAPVAGSTVVPGSYGAPPALGLSAQFQDVESSMNANGTVSFIKVADPQGGDVIGLSTTNGGGANNTLTINFMPLVPLNKGGNYKMTANTCNNAGLCVSREVTFTVYDYTPPSISAVELKKQTSASSIFLSVVQSAPEGPFENIAQVAVTLAIPSTSTNTIDWDLSNVTLYQVVGGVRVPVLMDKLSSGVPSDGKLRYKVRNVINYAGQFEIVTQAVSKDAAGQTFYGPPAGTSTQQFTTQVCTVCISTLYQAPGNDSTRPAIIGLNTLTVTSGVTVLNVSTIGVDAPPSASLPNDPGFVQLSSVLFANAMRFFVSGVLQTSPLTWTYATSQPVTFSMYYNDSDIPVAVAEDDLVVRGYFNGAWSTVSGAVHEAQGSTANSFSFSPTSSQPAAVYYAIKYPFVAGVVSTVATPTALAFKHTRAFNPTHANPLYRRARIYYSDAPARAVEAKVYDSSGQLVRSLAVGSGISLADSVSDPNFGRTAYYFEWDGRNDLGVLARNGLYLVRWKLTMTDGSVEFQTKPLAMIK